MIVNCFEPIVDTICCDKKDLAYDHCIDVNPAMAISVFGFILDQVLEDVLGNSEAKRIENGICCSTGDKGSIPSMTSALVDQAITSHVDQGHCDISLDGNEGLPATYGTGLTGQQTVNVNKDILPMAGKQGQRLIATGDKSMQREAVYVAQCINERIPACSRSPDTTSIGTEFSGAMHQDAKHNLLADKPAQQAVRVAAVETTENLVDLTEDGVVDIKDMNPGMTAADENKPEDSSSIIVAVNQRDAISAGFFEGQVIDQLVQRMRAILDIKKPYIKAFTRSRIEIQLKPENLGKVSLKLEMVDGMLNGKIAVQNPRVQQVIQENLAQLKETLEQQGLTVGGFIVNTGMGGGPGQQFFQQRNRPQLDLAKPNGCLTDDNHGEYRWSYGATIEYLI